MTTVNFNVYPTWSSGRQVNILNPVALDSPASVSGNAALSGQNPANWLPPSSVTTTNHYRLARCVRGAVGSLNMARPPAARAAKSPTRWNDHQSQTLASASP